MTNPYDVSAQYGQMNNPFNSSGYPNVNIQSYPAEGYNIGTNKIANTAVATVTGAALGFIGGSVVGAGMDYWRGRHPVNNNEVNNSFAQRVLNRIIKKDYTAKGKEFFKQKHELLKKLERVSSVEGFTKLMEKNKKYAQTLCDGISLKSMCDMVTKDNLKGKIAALRKRIEASLEPELQNIKDSIKLCWDSEKKTFVKPKSVDEKLFKIIKGTKNDIQWKSVLKAGGIGALIAGVGILGLEALSSNKQVQ